MSTAGSAENDGFIKKILIYDAVLSLCLHHNDMDLSELYSSCLSGDRKAMGRLYRICYPKMKGVVGKYIRDPERVKDVVHDGFVVIFTSLEHVRRPERLESWMAVVMRNLALQAERKSVSAVVGHLSEKELVSVPETDEYREDIGWEQLAVIIERLPEGYRSVFRLSMLDGLSHKEIGALLGIDPHSSSSQLSRAKAMLRRMIMDYRAGILLLAGLVSTVVVWQLTRQDADGGPGPHIADSQKTDVKATSDDKMKKEPGNAASKPAQVPFPSATRGGSPASADSANRQNEESSPVSLQQESVQLPSYEVRSEEPDTAGKEDIPRMPLYEYEPLVAEVPDLLTQPSGKPSWSVGAAYEGSYGSAASARFMQKLDDSSSNIEGDKQEIEVNESVKHHVPFVVGLSFAKRIDSRWTIETGIRYTYLRSDSVSSSEIRYRESDQRIHYIGIPLKVSYRLFDWRGLSVYGQLGGGLDIPVGGTRKIFQNEMSKDKPNVLKRWEEKMDAPLQWSVEAGIGLQYRFTPWFSIFAEPSVRYYFNPGSDVVTVRQDSPVVFTVPLGIRFTW